MSCEVPIKHDTDEFYLILWLDCDSSILNVINNCLRLSLTKRLENYSIRLGMLSSSMFTDTESWWWLVSVHDDYVRRRRTKYDELHFERRRCSSNRQAGRTATDSPDWRRMSDHQQQWWPCASSTLKSWGTISTSAADGKSTSSKEYISKIMRQNQNHSSEKEQTEKSSKSGFKAVKCFQMNRGKFMIFFGIFVILGKFLFRFYTHVKFSF